MDGANEAFHDGAVAWRINPAIEQHVASPAGILGGDIVLAVPNF